MEYSFSISELFFKFRSIFSNYIKIISFKFRLNFRVWILSTAVPVSADNSMWVWIYWIGHWKRLLLICIETCTNRQSVIFLKRYNLWEIINFVENLQALKQCKKLMLNFKWFWRLVKQAIKGLFPAPPVTSVYFLYLAKKNYFHLQIPYSFTEVHTFIFLYNIS